MKESIVFNLNSAEVGDQIGNKANNLQTLFEIRHIHLPQTWVIPWDVYQLYMAGDVSIMDALGEVLQSQIDPVKSYAVRSSSNVEDASFHSFAGLFKTILNVQGWQNVQHAVEEIWNAASSDAVKFYLEKLDLAPENVHMAVIVQEMVSPEYSGVLFSHNPMTGTNEVVIEGIAGEGSALVQDGVTPDRWIARSGSWIAKPDESLMPAQVAKKVLEESEKIRNIITKPIDLEWVYDGQDVYWVQMREITALQDLNIYSNRLSKDMMPGMIHPLIWSINVPLINSVWLGLLEELVGPLPIEAEDLAKSFFYRSYFNMGAIGEVFTRVGLPSEGLEMMMGIVPDQEGRPAFTPNLKMLPLIPKLLRFIVDKWHFERKITADLPDFINSVERFSPTPDEDLSIEDQLGEINRLKELMDRIVYLNIVTPLLVSMYSRMLEQQLKKMDIDLLQFDLLEGMSEVDAYNPNITLAELKNKYDLMVQEVSGGDASEAVKLSLDDLKDTEFEEDIDHFIEAFGHLSGNSNNFMAVPFRENPDVVLTMIRDYQDVTRDKTSRVGIDDLPVKGGRKWLLRLFYDRARKFTLYRERVSQQYVYGYGLFRPYFFRCANWMVGAGWMTSREDIFYLSWDEIQQAIKARNGSGLAEKIDARKNEMEEFKDIILPEIIYGEDPPPVFVKAHTRLHGTPTSQGYYAGPLKIIKGMDDFGKVTAGDVIVIPYSDVGWTPLFARAGAVIAESGGLLSHSSIIAREYQIPAIVSVSNCMTLKDNQRVSVNGFTGEIVLLDDDAPDEE